MDEHSPALTISAVLRDSVAVKLVPCVAGKGSSGMYKERSAAQRGLWIYKHLH